MPKHCFEGEAFSATGQAPIDFDVRQASLSGPDGARRLVVNARDHGEDVVIEAAERGRDVFVGTWKYTVRNVGVDGDVELKLYRHAHDEIGFMGTYRSPAYGPGFWAIQLHAADEE